MSVKKELQGKVALVTGGAQGIGYGLTQALLEKGAKVCLADVQAEKGNEVTRTLQHKWGEGAAIFIKCDVTSQTDLIDAFAKTKEHFGKLDIVCNNAGIVNEKEWKKCVDINLSAVIHGTLLAVEYMSVDKERNGGVVVNISSNAGLTKAAPWAPVYCATKHGVVAFSRSMALTANCSNHGVRINCLCPEFVDTDLLNASQEQLYQYEEVQQRLTELGKMPIRAVRAEDPDRLLE